MTDEHLILKAPGDERNFFEIPLRVSNLSAFFNGNFTARNGAECSVEQNIIKLSREKSDDITLAQTTNFWSVTANLYEDTWRKRSIGMISGDDFSLEDEKKLLQSWLAPAQGEWILDVGCSTAFYARAAVEKEPGARGIALDFSNPMLREARKKALEENKNLFLLNADASAMPFYAGSMDAMVSGGSLNEFAKPEKVLYEMRRVLKPDGRVFMMHLLKSDTWIGRMLQRSSELGGLSFWTADESEALFQRTGFEIKRRHQVGIVMFTLLGPV